MSRLTNADRERLRHQLLQALLPDARDKLVKLNQAAFSAVLADFFTPAGLKRIATLPDAWLQDIGSAYVVIPPDDGAQLDRDGHIGGAKRRLPCAVPNRYRPRLPTTIAAVRTFFTARAEAERARKSATYEIDTVLNASATLEAVLQKIPAARGILNLPAASSVADTAATINARLAKATAAPAKAPAPAAPRKAARAKAARAKAA